MRAWARENEQSSRWLQAAGGAWLGAGPAGERKIESTRTVSTRCARRSTRIPGEAGRRTARDPKTSTRCPTESADVAAAAANEASGSAPAGESPTSTAAHAAAILPRIRASLRPTRKLSTFSGASLLFENELPRVVGDAVHPDLVVQVRPGASAR